MDSRIKYLLAGIGYLMLGILMGALVLVLINLFWGGDLLSVGRSLVPALRTSSIIERGTAVPSVSTDGGTSAAPSSPSQLTATSMSPTVTPQPTDTLIPPTATMSATLSPTLTPSMTPAPPTTTLEPTGTPSPTATPVTPTATATPPMTLEPTATMPVTPTATATPPMTFEPTATPVTPTATPVLTMTLEPTATPVPPTATSAPTLTPEPTVTHVPPSATPSPPILSSSQIAGCVVRDGEPVGAGVLVKLETQSAVTETLTDVEGCYAFPSTSVQGAFSVVFAQEWNSQLVNPKIASWAWFEGMALVKGMAVEMPDLDISLEINSQYFGQSAPAEEVSISGDQISYNTPLSFEWSAYYGASSYWIDLGRVGETTPLWKSPTLYTESVEFYGILDDGSRIYEGSYWWSVGAQKQVGVYEFTVYSPSRSLVIVP